MRVALDLQSPHPAPRPARVAGVDIGTNTAQLVIADVHPDGTLQEIEDLERFVRLGEGVDRTGVLSEAAMDRAFGVLKAFHERATALGATAFAIGATSASRDAANTDAFARRVRDALGVDYRVISGETEARLSFSGALSAFPHLDAAQAVDVGGGSTELIVGTRAGVASRTSLQIGSVRITERCFPDRLKDGTPPSGAQVEHARRVIAEALDSLPARGVELRPDLPLLGSSGTARVLGAVVHPHEPFAPIAAGTLKAWTERLLALSTAEVAALDPERLGPRADVAPAAVLVLDAVVERAGADALWPSPRSLRHGLALEAANRENGDGTGGL